MIIGFTGTQQGMNNLQNDKLFTILNTLKPEEVHHGGCIGADDQFHDTIISKFSNIKRIHIHPSDIKEKQMLMELRFNITEKCIIYKEKAPLKRNWDIIKPSNILIATPKEEKEILRSGTWTTIRYMTRKLMKPTYIIYPNGNIDLYKFENIKLPMF